MSVLLTGELSWISDSKQVPNGKLAIERAARLVSPGGLLIIEDTDIDALIKTGSPAILRFLLMARDGVRARGGDLEIGRKLESILSSLEAFEHVHVNKVPIPCDGSSPGKFLQLTMGRD
jgi:hypothetical protein